MNQAWISRSSYIKFYVIVFLGFQVLRFINGLGLSQLGEPFIYDARQDPLLWVWIATGIPQWLSASPFNALTIDIIVSLFPILLFVFRTNIWSHRLSAVWFFIFAAYLLTIFSYPSLSIRKYLGLALIPLIFIPTKEEGFYQGLRWMRYYPCFIFFSAFVWKLTRGTLFEPGQFSKIMTAQHAEHLILFPGHLSTQLGTYFMQHTMAGNVLYVCIGLLQGSFLLGFFSRKYDSYLMCALALFVIGDFLFMRIEYWEFLVFVPLLLKHKQLTRLNKSYTAFLSFARR